MDTCVQDGHNPGPKLGHFLNDYYVRKVQLLYKTFHIYINC